MIVLYRGLPKDSGGLPNEWDMLEHAEKLVSLMENISLPIQCAHTYSKFFLDITFQMIHNVPL